MKTNKFPRAGYRIHFDRLKDIRTDASFIRTHKFKCEIPNKEAEQNLKEKFEMVAKVVDSNEEGSILWFLTQLYGLGFLFVSSGAKKTELIYRLNKSNPPEEIESILKKIPPSVKKEIKNPPALITFLKTTPREVIPKIQKTNMLPGSLLENLGRIFEKEKKITKKNIHEFTYIYKVHSDLVDFSLKRGHLKEKDIQDFFQEYWNTKPLLEQKEKTKAEKKIDKLTFVIQALPLETVTYNTQNKIDIFQAYFDYLLPASNISGIEVQSLMGASENQNGLSNLLGETLRAFQSGIENTKMLINGANPDYFKDNKDILEIISNAAYHLAKKIPKASEYDFFTESWNNYRNLVGGRLEGWISNFQNRLKVFKESLEPEGKHEKTFNIIKNNCDWENIFPETQKQNFIHLQDLRPRIYSLLEEKSEENLGALLFEYNKYLQSFNEFLMKWNNEGIPNSIKDTNGNIKEIVFDTKGQEFFINPKLLCNTGKDKKEDENENRVKNYTWKKESVPNLLEQYPRFIGEAAKDPERTLQNAYNLLLEYAQEGQSFIMKFVEVNENNKSETFINNWLAGKNYYGKTLESLKKLAFRSQKNVADKIWKFFETHILTENAKKTENWKGKEKQQLRFFVSGYERMKYTPQEVNNIVFSNFLKKFEKYFGLDALVTKKDFIDFFGLNDKSVKIENGEILKIYWGLLLRNLSEKVALPEKAEPFKKLQNSSLSNLVFKKKNFKKINLGIDVIRRFIQSSIGSEIRAKLSLLSRNDFVKRNVIQITNGEQSFLQYIPCEWKTDSVLDRENIQKKMNNLEEKMKKIKGTNSTLYKQLKQKLRRLRLAQRPQLEKLKKNLYHLERDLKNTELPNSQIKILQKRKKHLEIKISALSKGKTPTFSKDSEQVLKEFKLDQYMTNQEIVDAIWKIMPKTSLDKQKQLAKILGEIPHRWTMILKTKHKILGLESLSEGNFIEKSQDKNTFNFSTKKSDNLYAFPLQTSNVQKQFLERFLWGDRDEVLTEKIMGSTVIIEEKQNVIRNKEGIKVVPQRESFSLYWAVPFQFTKVDKSKEGEMVANKRILEGTNVELTNSEGKSQKQYRKEKYLMGIDLGEYGFGWAILDPKTEKFIDGGFQEVPLLQKMRESAASWKDTQSQGIFSRPTTHLAKIREQAAGQARNQMHRLALNYNAVLIYEDEVDGFESGGQRISKLYKTLKTADVIGANSSEADKTVRKHFWGIDYAQIASVIGAAKTSQTCRKCGRCATSEKQEEIKNATSKEEKEKLQSELENIKEKQRQKNPKKPERGGDALFVCQLCKNKTDADIQAAQNIALKYFFKISASEKEIAKFTNKKTGQLSSLKLFLAKSKNNHHK